MLELKGKTVAKRVEAVVGQSLLDHALAHQIDWGFSCSRGTCARCRCLIVQGMEHLQAVTDKEWERLDDDELEQGYRLGCQAVVKTNGLVEAVNKPYF